MAKMTFRQYLRRYWTRCAPSTLLVFVTLPMAASGKFMVTFGLQVMAFIVLNLVLLAVTWYDWKRSTG